MEYFRLKNQRIKRKCFKILQTFEVFYILCLKYAFELCFLQERFIDSSGIRRYFCTGQRILQLG